MKHRTQHLKIKQHKQKKINIHKIKKIVIRTFGGIYHLALAIGLILLIIAICGLIAVIKDDLNLAMVIIIIAVMFLVFKIWRYTGK